MKSTARQMEQSVAALKDSEARIRAVVDSALDGIITVSDSGRCESLNPAAARLFGYERHEIAGQRVDLLLPGVGAGDPMHPRPVLHDFGASPVATQARRKNGERFPAELVVSRGQLSGRPFFTCVVRDITERKRSEAELERHREHLASLVDERTAQLEASHQQLRLTERLAAIGTLAAGLGHDMNNVLFPVRCRLDALGSTGIDPTALPGELAAVRQAIDYLQQLCDGLRLLALDADDASACDAATQLGAWWREVKPLLLSALPRGVTLETRWPDDLPAIAVPAHRLTQAVFNLVVNAGEAIAREGVVTIGAALLEDHRFVRITVTDTGRGMSSEELRRALDPFFTTKKRGLATGLGLSLVHGVAHVAGGGVEIESAPGRGTSVQMTLPVAAAAAPTPAPAPSRTASVTLRDRRLATFVGALLRAQGIDVQFTDGAPQARSSLWITEPTEDHLEPARQFTHAGRSHRLILFGKIPNEWRALSAACVDESHGLDAIRGAIQLAVASPAGPSA
ncbi:MAG: PAS domain S-box protein [Planctomycetota bacterium]